jgi:toxin ParE1/3/4
VKLRITGPARRDIAAVLATSLETFGKDARDRYRELIERGLADIAAGNMRSSSTRPELGADVTLSHLRHARGEPAIIRSPRHFLVFRLEGETAVILRLLYNAMDLPSRMADDL